MLLSENLGLGAFIGGWAFIGGGVTFAVLALQRISEKKAERQRRERIIREISELITIGTNVRNLFNPKGLK